MHIQQSFKHQSEKGILYLVGTPIGNLQDMTYRAIETLKGVDLIAAEDTRQTIKLLNHFDIQKRLVSYHEHNKENSGRELIKMLNEGITIALVSDAGMPAISDPGYELVKESVESGISVVPIPGANAAISGLVASGLPTKRFFFVGFLPREKKLLIKELEQLKLYKETIIFYEAPHRIKKTLESIHEVMGDRKIVLIRELTKKHEEFIRGNLTEVIDHVTSNNVKGECMIITEGIDEEISMLNANSWWEELSLTEHINHHIGLGKSSKEAIKDTAKERDLPKREVYQAYHGF